MKITALIALSCAAMFIASCEPDYPGKDGAGIPPVSTEVCDGFAGLQCASQNDFCYHVPGTCIQMSDAQGMCQTKPEVCTKEYKPVCGCDGQTYGNECMAHAAGTSVAETGKCKT